MRSTLVAIIVGLLLSSCKKSEVTSTIVSPFELKTDSIVEPLIDSGKIAGVAIAVYKGGEKLLLKSYGYADLEWDVKLPINASFEIGSVSKQFTGAAILQLVEQGKLSLDDDITKFIKFNSHGKKITIRQLLSHTSGIKAYTEMPLFETLGMQKLSRDTLLRIVEKETFDFEPGEALIYNNTGFFMLGLIIEKVAGVPYEEYVAKNLFTKAGMVNSYYASERKVTKNRAHGYDTDAKGLERAGYLDHTWPYAAGSLASTVEDLIKWDDALHHGKIFNDTSYQEFISPVKLNDGTTTRYAKGITISDYNGHKMIEHGGGINGFLSENRYFPEKDLKIVVLINSTGPVAPGAIADQLTDLLLDKKPIATKRFEGDLSAFIGTYKGRGRGEDVSFTVTKNDSTLVIQNQEGKTRILGYLSGNQWSEGATTYLFKGSGKTLSELRIDQVYGYLVLKKEQK